MNIQLLFVVFCTIAISTSAGEEPKSGLLGYPLNTPLIVEGQSATKSLSGPRMLVSVVNGAKLAKPVVMVLRGIHELPPNTRVILRGRESAEEREGIGIRDWKVFGTLWYEMFFAVTEVIEPAGVKLEK